MTIDKLNKILTPSILVGSLQMSRVTDDAKKTGDVKDLSLLGTLDNHRGQLESLILHYPQKLSDLSFQTTELSQCFVFFLP